MFSGPGCSCSGSPKQALKLPARPSTPETCFMRLHEASTAVVWRLAQERPGSSMAEMLHAMAGLIGITA